MPGGLQRISRDAQENLHDNGQFSPAVGGTHDCGTVEKDELMNWVESRETLILKQTQEIK